MASWASLICLVCINKSFLRAPKASGEQGGQGDKWKNVAENDQWTACSKTTTEGCAVFQ